MTVLLWILYVLLLICLLVIAGVHPQLSSHSRFELQRRLKKGDAEAKLLLKRHALLRDIFSLQRVITAVLLVLISFIGVELFHWSLGLLISFIIALEFGAVARMRVLQQYSQRIYERFEGRLLRIIEKHPIIFSAIRSVALTPNDTYDIESKEELLEMVEKSGDVLQSHEKQLVIGGLKFSTVTVGDIMTPKSMIDSVAKDEMIGPLTLDILYKTGHSRFPVISGDIDHVVGMLYIQDLLNLENKKSQKAGTIMSDKVFYIRENQTIDHALAAFLRTQHHLFIVVNKFRETVGLLSLEDVIESLLGRKINDEFDSHDDLRKVAERNPKGNNLSRSGETI